VVTAWASMGVSEWALSYGTPQAVIHLSRHFVTAAVRRGVTEHRLHAVNATWARLFSRGFGGDGTSGPVDPIRPGCPIRLGC
jgi:hypothetical protein